MQLGEVQIDPSQLPAPAGLGRRLRSLLALLAGRAGAQGDLVSTIFSIASLLSSGVIAALCFTLLTSHRLTFMPDSLIVYTVLVVQWQTFGLTVAKMGIEQVVFAAVSRDRTIRFEVGWYLLTRSVPLALLMSLAAAVVFSPVVGVVIFLAILFDTHSMILSSDLNARRRFNIVSISNMLNYPVFFVLLIAAAVLADVDKAIMLGAFLIGSAARWCWLIGMSRDHGDRRPVKITCGVQMAGQQALNYVLFKADQLMLPVLLSLGVISESAKFSTYYLFLAKFPELCSGVVAIIGVVIFPMLPVKLGTGLRSNLRELRSSALWPILITGGIGLGFVVYQFIWAGGNRHWLLTLPFLLNALLLLPINGITYLMLAHGHLQELLRNLVTSVMIGLLILGLLIFTGQRTLLAWLVPIQFVWFLFSAYRLPLRERRPLYA